MIRERIAEGERILADCQKTLRNGLVAMIASATGVAVCGTLGVKFALDREVCFATFEFLLAFVNAYLLVGNIKRRRELKQSMVDLTASVESLREIL